MCNVDSVESAILLNDEIHYDLIKKVNDVFDEKWHSTYVGR